MTNLPRRLISIFGLAFGLLIVGGVGRRLWAQNTVEQRFDQLDRNGDGGVTPDELPLIDIHSL